MSAPTAIKPTPVYKAVAVPEGFAIQCNEALLKTPAATALVIPTLFLAEAIAGEWCAQTEKINHASMPLMQLAATAIDIVSRERGKIIDQLAAYTGSELLCHRAEQPAELAQRQQQVWQPLLDWCARRYDTALKIGTGIIPITQSLEASKGLRGAIEAYDNFRLAGLRQATDVSGSLVLALAMAEDHLSAEEVFHASELDTSFQIEKWGEDLATTKRRAAMQHDLVICGRWFGLLRSSS